MRVSRGSIRGMAFQVQILAGWEDGMPEDVGSSCSLAVFLDVLLEDKGMG